jgi:hypothetical protein
VGAGAVLLAVNGTLMRGLELNGNLLAAGARFVREAKTVPEYRLYSIGDVHPAMLRVPTGGASVALESDEAVLGEPWLCEQSHDITRHGGWRAYLDRRDGSE